MTTSDASLAEGALRKALHRRPSLSGYKPRRFAAGDERGGEFAPKGMGVVAYSAVRDAVAESVSERKVTWSGSVMHITEPHDAPANVPDWKPTMTRGEAEIWRQGNVLFASDAGNNEFYHGTTSRARESIQSEGFRLGKTNFGRLWGDGVYLAPEFNEAMDYAADSGVSQREAVGNVLTVFVRVKNPAVLDMRSAKWDEAIPDSDGPEGQFQSFRMHIINYFDLNDEFEAAKSDDAIERSGSFMQWVTARLQERGHDALVISGAEDHSKTTSMAVVFDPKNVVTIKNAKPPKWAQKHYGLTEAALSEGIRSLTLSKLKRKRYAKGTVFGGRFLPKGVSPFSSQRTVDARAMISALRDPGALDSKRAFDVHGPDLLDGWSEKTDAVFAHRAHLESGTIARDIVTDGVVSRRVRVMFDRETFSLEDDTEDLDRFVETVEDILLSWEDLGHDADQFVSYVLFTDKRSPSDAAYSDLLDSEDFAADATADPASDSIVFWNIGGFKHNAVVASTGWLVHPQVMNHELGHVVGDDAGPPDWELWGKAVNSEAARFDGDLDMTFYYELDDYTVGDEWRGQTDWSVRGLGLSDYSTQHMLATRTLPEDWAEAVRIYMKEKMSGKPNFVVGSVPPDRVADVASGGEIDPSELELRHVWFSEFAPERYALVHKFLTGSDPDMVESAIAAALSGGFKIKHAMYLKGTDGRFVGSRGRGPGTDRRSVSVAASRALSTERARKIASDRMSMNSRRDKPLKKSVTLGVTPYRGAGKASGQDYYETTRYKGFVNDIQEFSKEEGVRVQSVERVRGVWRGGGEPSSAVTLFGDDESVQRVMDRLGTKYNQDGVLSFRPSGGGDSFRYRSAEKIDPAALEEAMLDDRFSSIAGATILPDGRVEFVNIGGDEEVNIQIERLAEELGIEIGYDVGHAGLRLIEEDYPRQNTASSGSQSAVQEGGFGPGRGIGHVSGQGSGGQGAGGSREDQALAEAVLRLLRPSLSGRKQARYAKGGKFGGRFLPKGVSPFRYDGIAADLTRHIGGSDPEKHRWTPERIGLGPMTRVKAVTKRPNLPRDVRRAEIHLPSIDSFLPDHSVNMKNWSRVDEAVSVEHTDHMNGLWVRDLTLRRGRKIRIVVDHDLDVARTEEGRERLFAHLEDKLSVWAEAAPRKRVSKQLVITSQPYRDAFNNEPDLQVLGTADVRTRVITTWNMPQHFGRSDRMEIEGKPPFAELPLKTIDHELAHTIAPKGGPPDARMWEEAMVRDRRHMEANGFKNWIVPDWEAAPNQDGAHPPKAWRNEDGGVRWHTERSDVWGITRYASRSTGASVIDNRRASPKTHEDWAESVAMFMAQERANIGVIPALIEVPGQGTMVLRIDFYDWAPNRARLIQQYLQSGNQTRKDEIVEKFGLYHDHLPNVVRWPGAIMPWGDMLPVFQYDSTPDLSNPLDQLLHDTDKQAAGQSRVVGGRIRVGGRYIDALRMG